MIFFVNETEYNEGSLENQDVIDGCQLLVDKFLEEIEASDVVIYTETPTQSYMYADSEDEGNNFDNDITGIALSITLKDSVGTIKGCGIDSNTCNC